MSKPSNNNQPSELPEGVNAYVVAVDTKYGRVYSLGGLGAGTMDPRAAARFTHAALYPTVLAFAKAHAAQFDPDARVFRRVPKRYLKLERELRNLISEVHRIVALGSTAEDLSLVVDALLKVVDDYFQL